MRISSEVLVFTDGLITFIERVRQSLFSLFLSSTLTGILMTFYQSPITLPVLCPSKYVLWPIYKNLAEQITSDQ